MKDRIYIRKEYTPTEIAYLAGLVDGEGSIYIGNFSCSPKTQEPYFQTNIQITNTSKQLIDWLQSTFGGLVNNRRKQLPHHLQCYAWTVSGDRLTHLCELMLPYLTCKKEEAIVMLKMRETFSDKFRAKGWPRTNSPETLALRQQYMNEMRNLHVRTYSHKNHGHLPRVAMPPVLKEV